MESVKGILTSIGVKEITFLYPRDLNIGRNMKFIERFSLEKVFKAIKSADFVVFGGGNLFQDETSFKSFLYYFSVFLICRLLKKPVYLLGNGVGPLRKVASRFLIRSVVKYKKAFFYAREKSTERYLNKLGASVKLGSDLAVWVLRKFKQDYGSERKIIISPKKMDRNLWTEVVKVLRERGFRIYVLIASPDDWRYKDLSYISDGLLTGIPIKDIMSSSVVLSERFHPNFIAAYFGIPFVSVGSKKTERFVRSYVKNYPCIAKKEPGDVLLKTFSVLGKGINVREFLDKSFDDMVQDFKNRVLNLYR